jgi:methylmalonyl-CoA mutase N-terminal domain/subunit
MKKRKENMDQWENGTLRKVLERSPEREEVFKTESGIPVKRLYTPVDVESHGVSIPPCTAGGSGP